ncbi:BEL1-like homeodomain protein 7 [Phragmites australis]|uniref:BEL1-like homeodomain protein 7 n=1 Tax=Phragmites australis TaxID=29695 RepID=UPI002D7904DC|nr:BEL1-like homeodomain protein 7 [Phragmites australis]XP_062216718.1 BEL1-like homeodomain protein 7 [Phragmites australis]
MATFFSTSTNQRDLAGGGDMSFHHYIMSNPYSDSPTGGLIPLPATIVPQGHVAHGSDGRDEPAAFVNTRDGPTSDAEMGLHTQLHMASASAAQNQGLSLSLGTQEVPVPLYQYRPAGMTAAYLLSPNQSTAAIRNAQSNIYMQNSKYLKAARELLDEVVNVRDAIKRKGDKNKSKDSGESKDAEKSEEKAGEHEGNSSAELTASERQDLQNKVSALMALLDQVDRKYRHYHHQMQIIMSSFDAVAGAGAARPYTALALQTISRHFRSLRDAIGAQVQSLRRSLGEKDTSTPGGGLSRLRYIDQQLRQQRAMQQFGMMQQPQHAWRQQRGLPESAVSVLRAWLFEHFLHPYPKDSEKLMLARQTGLSRGQVSNWFINARVRLWKPMIEEMYKEEFGAAMDSNSSSENAGNKGKDEAISSEDRDEFQSPSSAAKKGAVQLSTFKSEAMGGLDAGRVVLSSLDGAVGTYATSLNLSHHGDARFVAYGDMAGHLGGYDGGSVSLTLGLQHCNDAGAVPAEQQGLLYGNAGDFEFMNGSEDRQRFGSSQLLHDFVA